MSIGDSNRLCNNFKTFDNAVFGFNSHDTGTNCKECAYFSTRNCGKNVMATYENQV